VVSLNRTILIRINKVKRRRRKKKGKIKGEAREEGEKEDRR
jgi:hypothetical protein